MFYVDQLVYILVETMALKNFVFRENWVGNKVAEMKIAVLVVFDSSWIHILTSKRPKYKIPSTEF